MSLRLLITRDPFSDYFVFKFEDGSSDEFEPDEARQWLKEHGADPDKAEKVLDHVWNFWKAEVEIENPKFVRNKLGPYSPDI